MNSVTNNMLPGVMSKLMSEESSGDLNEKVAPFMNWLFTEQNPIAFNALNTVMGMTGGALPVFRYPYFPCEKPKRR